MTSRNETAFTGTRGKIVLHECNVALVAHGYCEHAGRYAHESMRVHVRFVR